MDKRQRLSYHQYLYQKRQEHNATVQGLRRRNAPIGKTWEQGQRSFEALNGKYVGGHRNLRYDQLDTRNNYSSQRKYHGNYARRTMSSRLRYYQAKPFKTERYSTAVKPWNDAITEFKTFINSEFTAMMPIGWFIAETSPYVFLSPDSDFYVRVKKFDTEVCDKVYNFESCALKLSKSENNLLVPGRGKLSIVSPITRQSQWQDTILNDANVQTQTYTEAFVAKQEGSTNYYYNRYYVAGTNGKIYMVETRVEFDQAPHYINASKKIFDSFRVLGS